MRKRGPSKARRGGWRRGLRWLLWLAALMLVLPWLVVGALRFVDPPTSAFMLDYRLSRADGDPPLRQTWRPLEAISPQLQIAVIASEDQNFARHSGFDLEAIRDALQEESGRGASTISQQVAKNLFLWPGRSWLRKGLEAGWTVCIETLWPKRRILEVYLNIAEFGHGLYGAEAAAQAYFGKPAAQLGLREAAQLAVVLPSPRRYSVEAPGPYLRQRIAWVERQARQLGGARALERLDGADPGKQE
ncbi:monofunctional biosynthetic peptidoglycan transglycosylase [Lysobacter sp. CAU 1642]|uniref:Biosynthetic peptidoglycan transglycosylase n=2 Tax=Pseudomarimonas salicorniae TaxID=2933270 RepID=A0ABT0GC69_9GAMM|nr:monofunctional biosynthetic peptidoglycan transglycosylase [Lysobacter sp. CAU 1642]MCK7592126.1 monofunctional biosynthetic peptidoglycan transglycosylase [Lysobacter sp. CAU 1642]